MFLIIFGIILFIAAILLFKYLPSKVRVDRQEASFVIVKSLISGVCVLLGILCWLGTSFVYIDQNKVGHLDRIYWASSMKSGQIIAAPWQKGAQARIIMPGFHIMPFVKVLYKINELPIIEVPVGQYGYVTTKDGSPLDPGQYLAREWDGSIAQFTDAEYFLGFDQGEKGYKGPRGQMGPQLTVLRPGQYRINRYLYNVQAADATAIKAGFVGVIKSNVGQYYDGVPILPAGVAKTDLSVPIVPKGYKGVWSEVLEPATYYINRAAYQVTDIDTRVQVWKYLGGYKKRWINLEVGDDGKIRQTPGEEDFPMPEGAADRAITLRVEGWDVPQDCRVQVQVTPANAPFVVAAVGTLQAVEDKIITPNLRSILRNVVAESTEEEIPVLDKDANPVLNEDGTPKIKIIKRARKVLDLLYQREKLEDAVTSKLVPQGKKTGLTVQWIRFGDPAVPPELLVPGKRKQLAQQLETTYEQEKLAQISRVQTEKERARADQQGVLMESEIGIQVANNKASAREKLGIGEQKYLEAVAQGQRAQAQVLGEQKAFELAYLEKILDAAKVNSDMIKIPNILVMGDQGGFSGPAAILGASNLNLGLLKQSPTAAPPAK